MVLTTRSVDRVLVRPAVYEKPPQTVLENVAGEKMIGLLRQVGQLSDFAADIFANLFRDSLVVFQRIGHLNERVTYIEQYIPQVEQIFYTTQPAYFYKEAQGGAPFKRSDRSVGALFSAEYRPEPVSRVRAAAQPPPNVALLNDFAKNKNCLANYSDPSFFFQQWLKAEEERQKKLLEENQAKKSKKKKKPAEAKKTQIKQVESVKIKTFSAQGKEFEPSVSAQNTHRSVGEEPPLVEYQEEEDDDLPSPTSTSSSPSQNQAQSQAQAQYAAQQQAAAQQQQQQSAAQLQAQREAQAKYEAEKAEYDRQQAIYQQQLAEQQWAQQQAQEQARQQQIEQQQWQQQQQQLPSPPPPPIQSGPPAPGGPPPPPPNMGAGLPSPPPVPPTPGMGMGMGAPPPTPPPFQRPPPVPVPPTPVSPTMPVPPTPPPMAIPIPPAPPVAPALDAPVAPPLSPTSDFGGGGNSALLDGIRAGVTLKKATSPPAAPAGRTGLLAEIRSRGFQLNKVDREEIENKKPALGGGGGLNSIMDILARRSAIQGSSDEGSGSDDDWKE